MTKSATVTITVNSARIVGSITLVAQGATTVVAGATVVFNGVVFDNLGSTYAGVPIYLFINGVQQASTTSAADGSFAFNVNFPTAGTYSCDAASTTTNV